MTKRTIVRRIFLTGIAALTIMASSITAFAKDDVKQIVKEQQGTSITFDVLSQTWNTNGVADSLIDETVYYTVEQDQTSPYYNEDVTLTPAAFSLDTNDASDTQALTFQTTVPGVYTYSVKADAAKNTVKAGYTYDETVYTVRAYVKRDRSTQELYTTITVQKGDDESNKVDQITYQHTYTPARSDDATDGLGDPPVRKRITGDASYTDDTFTFEMVQTEGPAEALPLDENGDVHDKVNITPIDDKHNCAEFGSISFPVAGTYVYEVREVDDGQRGYNYSDTVYTIRYVVTQEVKDGAETGRWIVVRTFYKDGVELAGAETQEFEFAFTNQYSKPSHASDKEHKEGNGSLMVYKVDAADDNTRLAGATFAVTRTNGDYVTTITTNEQGMAPVKSLAAGIYRLKETNRPAGYQAEDRYVYVEVLRDTTIASPTNVKVTNTRAADVQHIVAIKQWANVDGITTPDSVTLALTRDGAVTDVTQIANAENNWTVDFGLVPADAAYAVVEVEDLKDYAVTTEKAVNGSDVIYTITNTYINDEADSYDSSNAYTGDNSHMTIYAVVMVAAAAGLAAWLVVQRRERHE